MSSLGDRRVPVTSNGNIQNGGPRATAGPAPASQVPTTRVMTPKEIMKRRNDREARNKAEGEARQREQDAIEEERVRERTRSRKEAPEPAGVAVGTATGGEAAGNRRPRPAGGRASGSDLPAVDTSIERRSSDRVKTGVTSRANPVTATQPSTYVPVGGRSHEQSGIPTLAAENVPGPTYTRSRPAASASASQPQPRQTQPQTRTTSATYKSTQTKLPSGTGATTQAQAGPSAAPSTSERPPAAQTSGGESRNTTTSSFPHAFERWETLSSHWEGLTSYWIRRLEGNSDEMNREPLNQQLARQVTDLSAAGANLFHAVVELQRLRASSERKFQRWFFETKTEQEKTRERLAELENALRVERQTRTAAVSNNAQIDAIRASAEQVKSNAEQVVKEKMRELAISREEARRAWEELGRREQEERERTTSLRNGEPTLVGGVQVVPMLQGATTRRSSGSRPPARDGPLPGDTGGLTGHPTRRPDEFVESPREGEVGFTNYDPTRSETDTDPFTEGGREVPPEVPPVPSTVAYPQQQTASSSTAATQATRAAAGSHPSSSQQSTVQAPPPTSSSGGGGTYLSYGPAGSTARQSQPSATGSGPFYHHQDTSLLPSETTRPRTTEADERSYVQSIGDTLSEEDYEMDERGEIRTDAQGNPILVYRHRGEGGRPASEDDSDEYDVVDQLERERMYSQRYGGGVSGISGVEYGHGPTGTAIGTALGGTASRPVGGVYNLPGGVIPTGEQQQQQQQAIYGASSSQGGQIVDYSGSGYGTGWESMPRHHHPTRLSDVLEEDERSRTSPSRASVGSRGFH